MIFPKKYTEHSIRTFTNKVFDLEILDPDSICIEDIARGLSNTARFAGQLDGFLSVAQHSCLVASEVRLAYKLTALLHDAAEAYIGDMPSSFKKLMPDFKNYENKIMQAIADKYGIEYPLPMEVKSMDKKMLSIEWKECVIKKNSSFYWNPKQAEQQFLVRFEEYLNLQKQFLIKKMAV
jgi:hypothetical protein